MPLTVTPFHPGDIKQALRQAQWLRELGRLSGRDLLLIADTRCSKEEVEALHLEYSASYDHVEVLDFVDHYRKWPESPNEVFATAARYIMRTRAQPWFFLEPDSVPLQPRWLDTLWTEYQQCGKPFMGDLVTATTAGINVIDHMSGNAFYPADMFTHAGLALISNEIPWDVAAASQIVPQMYATKQIQHQWKAPPFKSWQQVEERIRPSAVVYHANKTGELITLLREHRMMDLDAGKRADDGPMANIEQNAGGGNPACDISPASNGAAEPLLEECTDQILLKVDANGQCLGTFELDGGQWVPAKWPRETSNYRINVTMVDSENASKPWADKDSSLAEIGRLSSRLKEFCTGPVRTRQVRDVLRENGVIK